jgi:hypothetical protein
MQNLQLSRLMFLSSEIQGKKNYTRSKSRVAAWTIVFKQGVTVYYFLKNIVINVIRTG